MKKGRQTVISSRGQKCSPAKVSIARGRTSAPSKVAISLGQKRAPANVTISRRGQTCSGKMLFSGNLLNSTFGPPNSILQLVVEKCKKDLRPD